jgi:hypothetical protein
MHMWINEKKKESEMKPKKWEKIFKNCTSDDLLFKICKELATKWQQQKHKNHWEK